MTGKYRENSIQNREKYQNIYWVCKIQRKQGAEKKSKKLIIILQYIKNILKNKPFRPLHQDI